MKIASELYACLCVREFPTQVLLRLRPELRDRACVVMAGQPPLQQVCSLNRKARALGLTYGQTKVEVSAFSPLAVLVQSVDEEKTVKEMLLACAGNFSPRVEECSQESLFLCVIDVAGTEKLFGPAEALGRNLLSRIEALGIIGCIAISRNFHTAVTAAQARTGPSRIQLIADGDEKSALAGLPLNALHLTEEQTQIFALWGIRTLGMLADLPEKELIARMGQEGKRLRQLASGELTHLFRPVEPPFILREHMELDSPVESLDTLLFVVNVMLEQILLRAMERALAIASVTITLKLERNAAHTRTVRPALPAIDRQMWLKLLHLDLEAHPPQAAIVALTVDAEPGKTSKAQLGLFSPQLPEPARLDITLARIAAIVGQENVGCAVLEDAHHPDGFRMEPFRAHSAKVKEASGFSSRPAMRKIRPAEPIFVVLSDQRPQAFVFREQRYAIEHAYGPWLTSGEWWSPTLWGCEQWDVVSHARNDSMLCCCLVHDLLRKQWLMAALYD